VGRKKIYDEALLVNNPFVESPDFALNVRSFLNKEQYVNVKDISDGVITALPNTITTKFLIEQEPYVKVYNRKGYIHLNPAKVMEQIMVKDITTYRKCLQDLTIHMFVTPTLCEDVFWINPVFFFNGSRIEKYKHKIVEV
jgi:hypothetical protein